MDKNIPQAGYQQLSDDSVLTISTTNNDSFFLLEFAEDTTITAMTVNNHTDRVNSILNAVQPAGTRLFVPEATTVTIAAGGRVTCYYKN